MNSNSTSLATSSLPAGVSYSVVFRYQSDLEIDEEEAEDVNNFPGIVWRSHMIDFSISCWSGDV